MMETAAKYQVFKKLKIQWGKDMGAGVSCTKETSLILSPLGRGGSGQKEQGTPALKREARRKSHQQWFPGEGAGARAMRSCASPPGAGGGGAASFQAENKSWDAED